MGLVRYYDIAIGYVIVPIFRYRKIRAMICLHGSSEIIEKKKKKKMSDGQE